MVMSWLVAAELNTKQNNMLDFTKHFQQKQLRHLVGAGCRIFDQGCGR
jgi:hypothetical protein